MPWWVEPAALAGTGVFRLLAGTWRFERVRTREVDERLAGGQRYIFALWHACLLPTLYSHRDLGVAALVSRSRDGELITRVIERLGFVAARGSSHRAGRAGAQEMLEWAARGRSLAVTPDGPRGPAEVLKPGLVWLAARTGWPVVPVATGSRRAWVARSWDGFLVPQPFARVVLAYGDPIEVPRDLDEAAAESWRARLEQALRTLTADVRARARETA